MIYKPTLAYRVWNDDNNVWAEDKSYICPMGTLYFWERDYIEPARGNYTIEQCTGQKDKNGRMIYEGDIVTCQTRYGIDRGVVVWKDGGLRVFWDSRFSFPEKYHIKAYYGFTSYNAVIGNIHNNPELLEVEE